MNAAYSENSETDRAAHIWRYTPWKKAHPTGDINKIPVADPPKLSVSMSAVSYTHLTLTTIYSV